MKLFHSIAKDRNQNMSNFERDERTRGSEYIFKDTLASFIMPLLSSIPSSGQQAKN